MIKNNRKRLNSVKLTSLFAAIFAISLCVFTFINTASALLSETTINSEHADFGNKEQGAWKITQTATASSSTTAELKIKADSILKGNGKDKDIYVMLDTSGSMTNDRITKTTNAIKSLANTMLDRSNGDNRMAMGAFNSEITDVTKGWKTDAVLFGLYVGDYLPQAIGGTDYYGAIKQIDSFFADYEYSDSRDAIVLFITDGAPVENHPLEEVEYRLLKEKYPWLTVQGIQFEMGDEIIEQIKKVSDNQFASDLENVEDVVFEAALDGYKYNQFDFKTSINDDYYEIESINATMGEASVDGSNIAWDMSGRYRSGTKQTLTVKLKVKQACIDKDDSICPIEREATIKTQLPDTHDEDIHTTETPTLQFRYDISYDLNAPTGCDESANTLPATAKQLIYTEAQISNYVPTCESYQFRGWAIVSDIAYRYNENYFQMPEEDVILRAIWAKPSISKTMDGMIAPTTYATFKKAVPNTGYPAASRNGYDGLYTNIAGSRANIEHIVYSTDTPPIDVVLDEAHNFAAADSELPIYGYFIPETKTFYFYSDADVVYLNPDSRGLFAEFANLKSLEGVGKFDASKVTTLDYLFYRTKKLENPSALADWDMPNLTSLRSFITATDMTSLSGLEDWDVSKVTDMYGLVSNNDSLVDISALADWNTGSVTDLSFAFSDNGALPNLHGLENWNTSNVTNMAALFQYSDMLANVDALEDWDVSNVTNMNSTFRGNAYSNRASSFDISGISGWEVGNVTDMAGIFQERKNLKNIDALEAWRPAKVTTLSHAFWATDITDLNSLAGWRMPELTTLETAFSDCGRLADISGLSNWTVSKVTTMDSIFARDSNITSLTDLKDWQTTSLQNLRRAFWGTGIANASGLQDWDASKVVSVEQMFRGTSKLTEISDLLGWNTESLTNISSMLDADFGASSLTSLHGLENWKVGKVTTMGSFCAGCSKVSSISELNLWRPVALTKIQYAFNGMTVLASLDGLQDWRTPLINDMEHAFSNEKAITNVSQLSGWTTGTATNMKDMFANDENLTDISALSSWDIGSVTDLSGTFSGTSLANITAVSGWNTENVTTISNILYQTKITNLNALSGWNVAKVQNMWRSFSRIPTLTDISGLQGWTTSALTSFYTTFADDTGLTSLSGLSGFDTSKVTTMSDLFAGCTSLSDISAISGWSTGKVKNMGTMFHKDTSITSVSALAGWNVESVTNLNGTFNTVSGVEDFSVLDNWRLPSGVDKRNAFANTSATATLPSWYQ